MTASADHKLALVVKPPPQPGKVQDGSRSDVPRIINRASGKEIGTIMLERPIFLRPEPGSYFSPCGRFLVVRGKRNENDAQWCYALPSQLLFQVPPRNTPDQWAFSADGKHVAFFENDGTLAVRSLVSGKQLYRLAQPPAAWDRGQATKTAVAFAPTGAHVASWNAVEDEVCIWNVKTGRRSLTLPVKQDDVSGHNISPLHPDYGLRFALAWSATGHMLATTSAKGRKIQIWEVASGKLRKEWDCPGGAIISLAFSPDGRMLACGNLDSTVLILDVMGAAKN